MTDLLRVYHVDLWPYSYSSPTKGTNGDRAIVESVTSRLILVCDTSLEKWATVRHTYTHTLTQATTHTRLFIRLLEKSRPGTAVGTAETTTNDGLPMTCALDKDTFPKYRVDVEVGVHTYIQVN